MQGGPLLSGVQLQVSPLATSCIMPVQAALLQATASAGEEVVQDQGELGARFFRECPPSTAFLPNVASDLHDVLPSVLRAQGLAARQGSACRGAGQGVQRQSRRPEEAAAV